MGRAGLRWALWASGLAVVLGSARLTQPDWGWWYNNGAPLPMERRVNIIAQMPTNGANAAAAAAFCKCALNTVYKWWRRWNQTGGLSVLQGRRGPPLVLGPAALLYLLCISRLNRKYRLDEYRQRLLSDIGVDASEVRICVALKRLGQHRKAVTQKNGCTPCTHTHLATHTQGTKAHSLLFGRRD